MTTTDSILSFIQTMIFLIWIITVHNRVADLKERITKLENKKTDTNDNRI
jgi:hypothetical protein